MLQSCQLAICVQRCVGWQDFYVETPDGDIISDNIGNLSAQPIQPLPIARAQYAAFSLSEINPRLDVLPYDMRANTDQWNFPESEWAQVSA